MEERNPAAKRYLEELYSRTQGDADAQVSMFEVGEALGLEKAEAGALAEDLIILGWVELKTLSGGIGITSQGMEILLGPGRGKTAACRGLRLGNGEVVDEDGRIAVDKILIDIKEILICGNKNFGQVEEMVIDMKTIEIQMVSPKPKTAIIREVLRSLNAGLKSLGEGKVAATIDAAIAP